MNLRRFIPNTRTDSDRPSIDLETDDVYRVLSARRRRLLLKLLDDHDDEEMPLDELAREIAAQETSTAPRAVTADAYEATYVALYQSHLPVLEGLNIVEWDRDAGLVRCGPSFPGLADVVQEVDRRIAE